MNIPVLPHVPPTPFQQFQQLNLHLLTNPTEPNVRMYINGIRANLNILSRQVNLLERQGHLHGSSPQLRQINNEIVRYMEARREAERIYKGLRTNIIPTGAGFSREREHFNNIRKVGGRIYIPKEPPFSKEKRDPALESESDEETWDFPYRFTDEFVDRVEEIYELINDNGDYERARELFQQHQIGTIFREDMIRLQNDMRNGMDLDVNDENFIRDLRGMVEGIIQELRQHFGKRKRGGK